MFGYFKKEITKLMVSPLDKKKNDGKWWYEMKFIPSYSIPFHYYF
jgi:hypothetical protein